MSNQNPLVPQGSMLEQKAKAKPHLRVAYIIVALHVLFLGGLLIQGCKREDQAETKSSQSATNESALPPLDSTTLYSATPGTSNGVQASDAAQRGTGTNNLTTQVPIPTRLETPAPVTREYVVLKGDSFYSIGKKFGVSASAIAKANPGMDPTRLKLGDKLQIPAAASAGTGSSATLADAGTADFYVVKSGDTLGRIAKLHGTSVAEIRTLNGLKTDRINAGQKLKLPAAQSAPVPAAAALTPPSNNPSGATVPAAAGTTPNP